MKRVSANNHSEGMVKWIGGHNERDMKKKAIGFATKRHETKCDMNGNTNMLRL